MGRPEQPLQRDGSAVREFAFWLRDLRHASGLTYAQLGKKAHYATSTVQEATAANRLPTLKVTLAFVRACGGDVKQWHSYWTQIHRLLDHDAPQDAGKSVAPPWTGKPGQPGDAPDAAVPDARSGLGSARPDDGESWYIESFTALLRLDTETVEAVEQRRIVAARDGLAELETAISVPRHPADDGTGHHLDVELLHGGSLALREQPFESFFRNVIILPESLRAGQSHEYALRLSIPKGQPLAPHYVHVPFRRSDYFQLRVRFHPERRPTAVWRLTGAPTAVIYERVPSSDIVVPDRFGEVCVEFRALRPGLGYGLCWQDPGT